MNARRRLLIALGSGALTAPFSSFAQQPGKVWRVGYLHSSARPTSLDTGASGGFMAGMRELGYTEGKNLIVEWRFSEGRPELLPVFAAELVRLQVDVIVTASTPATIAAQKATTTIPIVMTNTGDPVGTGLVKSLAHPGGNITGTTSIAVDLIPKLLEMLRSMAPRLSRVAVLVNPDNSFHAAALKSVQDAALRTGTTILSINARTPQEIENAFARMVREKAGGLIVIRDLFFVAPQQVRQIADLAAKNRLPSIAAGPEIVEAGALMSYGANPDAIYRRTATYVDKIFKGAKPADLPVEQPMRFELIINGKTAKALGLKIPQSLLVMADKVIE